MYWGNSAVWAFLPRCLIDFECVNKLIFEHVFSVFILCSHLLLSSCNRCIHTLGSPCTPLHAFVSYTFTGDRQRQHHSQLTMYSHMIIMYMYTKEKHRHTQIHAGRNTPIRPHTCCSSSSTAPCVNGWESNYYSHAGTTFSTLVSEDMCACRCVCACVSVSGSGGVSYCQHRAHTLLISRLSLFPSFGALLDTFAQKHTRLHAKHC